MKDMSEKARNMLFLSWLAVCCSQVVAVDSSSFFKSKGISPSTRRYHSNKHKLDPVVLPWALPRGGEISQSSIETVAGEETDSVKYKEESDDKDRVESSDISNNDDEDAKEEISFTFAPSKVGDGSESDPDGLPSRYLRMQKGDREKAKAAFDATVKWRDENGVNTILGRPYEKFDMMRRIFTAYIPGRDLSNNIVIIQRPGMVDYNLKHKNNITDHDMLMHYVYMCEYCWNILEPGPPDGVMTTVMDLTNISFSTLKDKEQMFFIKKFVKMMSDHYPQRSYKTLIINAPTWVNMGYKIIKPLLRESTKKKITIINGGKKQDDLLIEILGKDAVPKDLLVDPKSVEGRREDNDDFVSKIEEDFRSFCVEQLERHGVAMQQIVEL